MAKFKVWDTNEKIYGEFDSIEDAYKEIQKYTVENNIDVFYYRQNLLKDGSIYVDYGSYTHFFYIKEIL